MPNSLYGPDAFVRFIFYSRGSAASSGKRFRFYIFNKLHRKQATLMNKIK